MTTPDDATNKVRNEDLDENKRNQTISPMPCAICGRWPTRALGGSDFVIPTDETDDNLIWNCPECHVQELNLVAQFIEERCVLGRDYLARTSELLRGYAEWCDDNHLDHPLTERNLEADLDGHFGWGPVIGDDMTWLGLRLRGDATVYAR